jgi:urease gamma subunit
MAEARKMMDDPDFKKKMKELTTKSEFKESVKKTKEMLNDPNKAAETEAKFEHMQRVGKDQLKQNAANDMQKAMEALSNPEVMEEMMNMLKDPKFKQTFDQVSKNPQFQNYIDAMKEMKKDPAVQKKFAAAAEAVKAQL